MYCTLDKQLLEHSLHHYCYRQAAKLAVKKEHIEESILENVDFDAGDYHIWSHIQPQV